MHLVLVVLALASSTLAAPDAGEPPRRTSDDTTDPVSGDSIDLSSIDPEEPIAIEPGVGGGPFRIGAEEKPILAHVLARGCAQTTTATSMSRVSCDDAPDAAGTLPRVLHFANGRLVAFELDANDVGFSFPEGAVIDAGLGGFATLLGEDSVNGHGSFGRVVVSPRLGLALEVSDYGAISEVGVMPTRAEIQHEEAIPGVGFGGLRIGQTTAEDVAKAYGATVEQVGTSFSVLGHPPKDDVDAAWRRLVSPTALEFEKGRLARIEFGWGAALVTVGGRFVLGLPAKELRKRFGKPTKERKTSFGTEWVYPKLGVTFSVEMDRVAGFVITRKGK